MVITAMVEYQAEKREGWRGVEVTTVNKEVSVDCQRRKDLKQVREEGMQISGGKSISQRRNSK